MTTSVPLVAIAGWILPGSGYVLIGQRWRGIVTGISIISLFLSGLLIGGVRVIEVPGYKVSNGERQMIDLVRIDSNGRQYVDHTPRWSLIAQPLAEIRDKPWSVPQALAGPMAIVAGATSVWSAGPADPKAAEFTPRGEPIESIAPLTHARINELGSLYLSVAGLLNLMVIIDSAWRAHLLTPKPAAEGE